MEFYEFKVNTWFLFQIGFAFQIYQQETIKNMKQSRHAFYTLIWNIVLLSFMRSLSKICFWRKRTFLCTFYFALVLAEVKAIFFV